ncbi:hypothetical protein KKG83_03480 [Candidatus Micrarchaeota archaeon]|nr:hypothetical protein [Candidatus Micrarchaeota archaeon]
MNKAPRRYVKKIKEKVRENSRLRRRLLEQLNKSRKLDPIWSLGKLRYSDYNDILRPAFSTGLLDAIKKIPRRKNRRLRIIEDGAGSGIFSAELKEKLNEAGIPNEITALSLTLTPQLKEKHKTGKIDRIVLGPAEFYVLKQEAGVIISISSSPQYTLYELKKNLLLKFANSLTKGGIFISAFSLGRQIIETRKINGKEITLNERLKGIERTMKKRGFEAKFYPTKEFKMTKETKPEEVPPFILVIKRIR